MKYKFIKNLTSDVMFEAYGESLKELFENSATALFSVICQIKRVKQKKLKKIKIKADDLKGLMLDWLQELISIVDTDEIFLSKFNVKKINEKSLEAECLGDEIKPQLGETVVKGISYHNFKLERKDQKYFVRVTLDI